MKNSEQNFLPLNTQLLHGKNWPPRWCFLRSFLTKSKPSRRSSTAAKRKEKERRSPKIEKPKDAGHLNFSCQNFDFCAHPSQNVAKHDSIVARRASSHVANAFLTRLMLIWPRSSLKTTKTSKNAFLAKSFGSQWVHDCTIYL